MFLIFRKHFVAPCIVLAVLIAIITPPTLAKDVQPGEDKYNYLTSIGAGIRLWAIKYFSARLDYSLPNIDDIYKTKNSEIYMQAIFSFTS